MILLKNALIVRQDDVAEKLNAQTAIFKERDQTVALLRAFFERYWREIGPYDWLCYAHSPEIIFDKHPNFTRDEAATLARIFGADGWKSARIRNDVPDWFKEVGGVKVIIRVGGTPSAPVEDVKL